MTDWLIEIGLPAAIIVALAIGVSIGLGFLVERHADRIREQFIACTTAGVEPLACYDLLSTINRRVDTVWERKTK